MLSMSSEVMFRKNLEGSRTQGLGPPSNSISFEEPRVTTATGEGSTAWRRGEVHIPGTGRAGPGWALFWLGVRGLWDRHSMPRNPKQRKVAEGRALAHLEGQVGSDRDSGTQVDVAMCVAHEECGRSLGLGPYFDTTTVVRPWWQPP